MSKNIFFLLFIAFCAALSNVHCAKAPQNLRDYYYALDGKTRMYEYVSMRDDSMPAYYIEVSKADNNMLITKRIDATSGNIQQVVREEVVLNGTVCTSYKLMQYDHADNRMYDTDAKINPNANTFFAFDAQANKEAFPFEISWTNPIDTLEKNRVTRSRLFTGFVTKEYNGKTYDCAEFVVKTRVQSELGEEGTIAPEYVTTEYYAKNIGLIYSKSDFNGKIVEYLLKNVK